MEYSAGRGCIRVAAGTGRGCDAANGGTRRGSLLRLADTNDNPDMARVIGVFDSGVGGLTVVRALREALPGQDIVYLGDTARVPYGSKSRRTVERYAGACVAFLRERRVDLVVVACNTASALASPALADAAGVPVIGAVDPGADAALEASRAGRIGVLGTLATIRAAAYDGAIRRRDAAARVTELACPLLVPLAEEGWQDDPVADEVCSRYVDELFSRDPDIDTVVLGCTHYPLLSRALSRAANARAGRELAIVDSATAMAGAARHILAPGGAAESRPGALRCFVTDATRMDELAPRFLGDALGDVELVDLA